MKNKAKILLILSQVPLLTILLVSCGGSSSSATISENSGLVTSETGDSSPISTSEGNTTVEEKPTTIYDAYEDSRPDYGSIFDYDSDYEPMLPPDENIKVTITIDSSSPVKFKDGSKTLLAKPGDKLTIEDFDLNDVVDGRTLMGLASLNNDGTIKNVLNLDSFAVPRTDITIIPFFSSLEGYTDLDIGSGWNYGFNPDGVPGSFVENGTIKYEHDALINAGDGYFEKGAIFRETSPIDIGSGLRLDTKSSLITETAVYEFIFNFENKGTEDIHLDGYQISSSSEYKNSSKEYENRYRMDIDLAPGECKTYVAQYQLGKNGNALTYFVADRSMDSMVLGVSMSMKVTDLEEPTIVSEPEVTAKGTINLQLPEGVKVSEDYLLEAEAGTPLVVPTANQVTNNTEYELAGWYNVATKEPITDTSLVSDRGITIAPYFAEKKGYVSLVPTTGASGKINYDQVPGSITNNKTIRAMQNSLIFNENGLYEIGTTLTETSKIDIGSALRLDTSTDIITDTAVYEFVYNFENKGTEEIHLDGYQISSSSEYKGQKAYESRYRMDIDLKPGETKTFVAQYKLNQNGSALTYFVADASMENMILGMTMSVKVTDLEEPTTISKPEANPIGQINLQLPKGISVSSDYDTVLELGSQIILPTASQIANTTGKEIGGWYIVGEPIEFITSTTILSETSITIAPYFVSSTGQSLRPGEIRNNLPDYYGHIQSDGTFTDLDKTTFEGQYGIINDELGLSLKHKGTLYKDDYFRLLTNCGTKDTDEGLTSGKKYRFDYNIVNNGNSEIRFNLVQVQGTLKIQEAEGAVWSDEIVIAPGETKAISIEFLCQSSNDNAMTIFIMNNKVSNMDIGVSMVKTNLF